MFIDPTGSIGAEHARDLRRAAAAFRAGPHRHPIRAFAARTQLSRSYNYRPR